MSRALAGKRKTPKSKAYRAQAAAERTIQDRATLILSACATEVFVDAMVNPAKPGSVLRAAARHYKNSVSR